MPNLVRPRRLAVVAALALATIGTPTLTAAAQAGGSDKPGLVGGPVLLQDNAEFSGFDVAYDASGTAYIGWIGSAETPGATRAVHLCTLPPGAAACSGGVQTLEPIDPATSTGLRVLVTPSGAVTLIWSHDADVPAYAGRDERISETTSQGGSPLTPVVDVADAPTETSLYDAVLAPGGAIWTAMAVGAGTNGFELREGVTSAPVAMATPYAPGTINIAFSGSTPVIAIQQDAQITHPVAADVNLGAFHDVAKTWTAGANIGLVATKTGVRLIASIDDSSYWPVVAKWTGAGFSARKTIGDDAACAPSTHDLGTDASGRLVDIGNECGKLTVYNLPGTTRAGIVRFSSGGVDAAGPAQIASTPRGHAIAVWAIESPGVGNRLFFGRVLLPGLTTAVSKSGVTVTGPASCLPASTIAVSVKGGKAGWKVASASLSFGGNKLGSKATIDGAKLTAGKVYTLSGTVEFTKGGVSSVGTASLSFRSCGNP